jgi:hypothetical protein
VHLVGFTIEKLHKFVSRRRMLALLSGLLNQDTYLSSLWPNIIFISTSYSNGRITFVLHYLLHAGSPHRSTQMVNFRFL